jgi:hypothetical protein
MSEISYLHNAPTCMLGLDLASALDEKRKAIPENKIRCATCPRYHSGVYNCEFCLANELYTRRKTMAFMRLDLCVQAAVCLIAKHGQKSRANSSRESISNTPNQAELNWEEIYNDKDYI